ncbi:MAG: helix-turn-helix domain-containing protein [Ruminococcaceae bacterium]|nr:helix-turn-helix domain-containing protein [Oscillospiraceae bacterium]
MDLSKIGKFIAEQRKKQGMTQAELAEKLYITDRAVSKWETGKSMPDSSIMLDLCKTLNISVNDLLSGEVVTKMDNYNEKLEQNLLEMVKEKEKADRRLLTLEWVIGILSILVLLIPIMIASYVPNLEDWQRIIIVFSGVIPCFVGFFFAIKIEQVAGYYECKHCGHRYVPTFKAATFSMHMGRTRYMKCPKCGKKSWQKKVISKEEKATNE